MRKSKFHTLLREPLLHFLVIGAVLFFIFDQVSDSEIKTDNRIVITQADLDQLAITWQKNMGRPPSAQEREQQLEHYIREQVLYREAMAMGLDQGDAVVRRRLAKKMEYLFNNLSFIPEPTEAELTKFLSEHTSKFSQPADITFSQIFFDPNYRNQKTNEDAEELLKQLKKTTAEVDTINMGDRSLLPYNFTNERKNKITSMFGKEFSKQAFALPAASWQGPITSEYGIHLIYINSRTEARLPPLTEIHERVANEWRTMKEHATNEIFYQSLQLRYEIILDDDDSKSIIVSAEQ